MVCGAQHFSWTRKTTFSLHSLSLPTSKSADYRHSLPAKQNRFRHNWVNQSCRCHQTLNRFPLCCRQLSFPWKIVATLLCRIRLQFIIFSVGPTHQSPPHEVSPSAIHPHPITISVRAVLGGSLKNVNVHTYKSSSLQQKKRLLKCLISSLPSVILWHHTVSSCHTFEYARICIHALPLVWSMRIDLAQLLCCSLRSGVCELTNQSRLGIWY